MNKNHEYLKLFHLINSGTSSKEFKFHEYVMMRMPSAVDIIIKF